MADSDPRTQPSQARPLSPQPPPQPAVVQQPVYVPVSVERPSGPTEEQAEEQEDPQLIIYSHSSLLYWWPVWVVGYVVALITYLHGQQHRVGTDEVWFHTSSNLGVVFCVTVFLITLITNVAVRGLASVIVILSVVLVTVLLAWFGWWDPVLEWIGGLRVYLNLGAYLFLSTLVFVVWALTVFVFDRMSYWRIKPGQVTHEFVLGAAARSFDTDNLVLEKFRDDLFRHWVLGLGSGDLLIKPYGADRESISIPNVLFIGSKVHTIQHMIATEPAKFGHSMLK